MAALKILTSSDSFRNLFHCCPENYSASSATSHPSFVHEPLASNMPEGPLYLAPSLSTTTPAVCSASTSGTAAIAAIEACGCPPMLLKNPPTYTVGPLTARALTELLAFGSQVAATAVVVSGAAIRSRACPPMLVNVPPA